PARSAMAVPTRIAWAASPAGTRSWTRTTTWSASGMSSSRRDRRSDRQRACCDARACPGHRRRARVSTPGHASGACARPAPAALLAILHLLAPGRADDAGVSRVLLDPAGLRRHRLVLGLQRIPVAAGFLRARLYRHLRGLHRKAARALHH